MYEEELRVLRAVGQTRRQLRAMVRDESVVIAAFTAPLARLAVILAVGALAGVLAGLRPARRAARLDVLQAIRSD